MKTKALAVLVSALSLGSLSIHAQQPGTLIYSTRSGTSLQVHVYELGCNTSTTQIRGNAPEDQPPGLTDYGSRRPVSGSEYGAELWAGSSPDESTFLPVPGSLQTFRPDGYVVRAGALSIPGTRPGQRVYLQLRAWGFPATSWPDVTSLSVPFGLSKVFRSAPLGGVAPNGEVFLSPDLKGLESFSLMLAGDFPAHFDFANEPGTPGAGSTGPVYDLDGQTKLSGDRYLAACFVGMDQVPESQWLPLAMDPAPFLQGERTGYWELRRATISSISPEGLWRIDSSRTNCQSGLLKLQARVWRAEDGRTFGEARSKSGIYGISPAITFTNGFFVPSSPVVWPSFQLEQHVVLRLVSLKRSATEGTTVTLSGAPGLKFVVKSSSNLIRWAAVATGSFEGETATITLPPAAGDAAGGFYRAEIAE